MINLSLRTKFKTLKILTKEQINQSLFENAKGFQDLSENCTDFFGIFKDFLIMLSICEDSCDLCYFMIFKTL